MSSRKKKRRKNKHRRTNSDVLSTKDAHILQAILRSQHRKQEEPKQQQQLKHSQGSLYSTIESIDHVFNTSNACSCNKFVIYDILCVIIVFSQMSFYYYLIGSFAENSPTLSTVSCIILFISRFIWSLYLSHYMKHKIIPYLLFYCIILTDFVLPIFLLFKYFATDLYSTKSLNHAIRSQLFIICIPMSIIQVIDMILNQQVSLLSCLSICIMIISIGMEYWLIIRHSLSITIKIFHLLSFLLDIFKFYLQIYIITWLLSCTCMIPSFICLFGCIICIKIFIVTPFLAVIILASIYFPHIGYAPYFHCEPFGVHLEFCLDFISLEDLLRKIVGQRFEVLRKVDLFIVHPLLFTLMHVCCFFYVWIGLELLCWSSFWFIFHSRCKNMFGVHSNKLKYILSFLLQSVNWFDYKIRLHCLHYILYDGYGWWQRKNDKIEKVLQKYIDISQNVVEQQCDITQFTPSNKTYMDEISNNVKVMISDLLFDTIKIVCAGNEYLTSAPKKQKYLIYIYYGFNIYCSLVYPLILLIYCVYVTNWFLLFKFLCVYFAGLLVMSYFMFEYYKYLHASWHCSLINFQYPIQIELLAPFYEYIHTYYGRIELIKTYFGSLSDLMSQFLGLNVSSSKSIVRDGMKYASENQMDCKVFVNFAECQQVVWNLQQNRKIYPNFNLYLFDKEKFC